MKGAAVSINVKAVRKAIQHTIHPVTLKNAAQMASMAEGGQRLFELFRQLKPFIVPGTTGIRIQEFCLHFFKRVGLTPIMRGFCDYPESICVSVNDQAAHGLPDTRPLRAGDLVTIDLAARLKVWCCDAAWTYLVPPFGDTEQFLVRGAWQVCLAALKAAASQQRISAMGEAAQQAADSAGVQVLPQFGGHGIGRQMHEAPRFSFLGAALANDCLQPGMVINVEPVVCPRKDQPTAVGKMPDGWTWRCLDGSPTAQFEFSLACLPDGGHQVLTFPDQAILNLVEPPF